MENKKPLKPISKKTFNIFLGIFLALFSIILFINQTAVPRVFTFGFAYLLGMASYLVYIVVYLIGMAFIFHFKAPRGKFIGFFIGTGFLVLGAIVLSTHLSVSKSTCEVFAITGHAEKLTVGFSKENGFTNFADAFNEIFFSKKYITEKALNFFATDYSIGSGIFGYLLLACGNQLFNSATGGLTLAIIFFACAFVSYAIPIAKKIIVNVKNGKKEQETEENLIDLQTSETVPESRPHYEDYNASGYDEPKLSDNSFYLNDFNDTENGVFKKPVFSLGDEDDEDNYVKNPVEQQIQPAQPAQPTHVSAPAAQNYQEASSASMVMASSLNPYETKETVRVAPVESSSAEQVNPVNEVERTPVNPYQQPAQPVQPEKPVIDESLVGAKPVFAEPQEDTSRIFTPASAPVTPVPQQPVAQEPEQPKKERVKWVAPTSDLLATAEIGAQIEKNNIVAEQRKMAINEVFNSFHIGARVEDYTVGSSVTRFNVKYESNVSSKSVNNIVPDISIRLNGVPARFVPIVEGQSTSGLEIPNAAITTVTFKEVFTALPDVKKHPLAVAFGKNISGDVIWADYDEFPHLLVAGTTGSGKSIFVNSLIATLIMRNSPDDFKIVLVDPKTVEMTRYKDMPHLLRPIIYTPEDALACAKKLVQEMERRYKLFGESSGATNIKEYNGDCEKAGKPEDKIPYILFVLDEYADLIDQCKELSMPVVSIAQKARACGIHLMISTQRPSTNVVTGTIKANLPTHVALMTANTTDSITIIGEGGAEKLLGKGDMLVQSPLVSRVGAVRLQGCYASRDEIVNVVNYLKQNYKTVYDPFFENLEEAGLEEAAQMVNTPEYLSSKEGSEEEKYQSIKEWVMAQEYMSISRIQRECSVGFNRAGRFFTRMQKEGIVDTEVDGNKGCKVLMQDKFGEDVDVASDEQSYFREDD